jgi:hypothetical protein
VVLQVEGVILNLAIYSWARISADPDKSLSSLSRGASEVRLDVP